MKTVMKTIACLGVVGSLQISQAGEFINLEFDQPRLDDLKLDPELQILYGSPEDLVPGWTITQNGIPVDRVWYYNQGRPWPITLSLSQNGAHYIQYNGSRAPAPETYATTLSQVGTVPEWAVTLEFRWFESGFFISNPLRINGEVVPIHEIPDFGGDFTADISRWAGQEVTLSMNFDAGNSGSLHYLRFTVPEPSTWALLGVGGAGLGWLALRGRKRG